MRSKKILAAAAAGVIGAGQAAMASTPTLTWPTALEPVGFINKLLTDNATAVVTGAVVIVGLTVLMYVKRGFGKKAGQTAGN